MSPRQALKGKITIIHDGFHGSENPLPFSQSTRRSRFRWLQHMCANLPWFQWKRVSQPRLRHWSYSVEKKREKSQSSSAKSTSDFWNVKLKIWQTFTVAQTQEQDGGWLEFANKKIREALWDGTTNVGQWCCATTSRDWSFGVLRALIS